MKIVMLSGSRNPEGQTARAAQAVLEGGRKAGAEDTSFYLPAFQLERCRQCEDNGWGLCRKEGRCVIEDDFPMLVHQVREADAVVFANPVYYADLSESLRAFTDRLRRTCMHPDGKAPIQGKPVLGVCVAGGSGGGAPECCRHLEKVLSRCGFATLDMIAVRRQNLDVKLPALTLAGEALARGNMAG